jgi:hypothetical protein
VLSATHAQARALLHGLTDEPGALPATIKALGTACAAAIKGREARLRAEIGRAAAEGLAIEDAWIAAARVEQNAGEPVFRAFLRAIELGFKVPPEAEEPVEVGVPSLDLLELSSADRWRVLIAMHAPAILAAEHLLDLDLHLPQGESTPYLSRLLDVAIAAASQQVDEVRAAALAARVAGASDAEIVEIAASAAPIMGVRPWLRAAHGLCVLVDATG